MSGLNNMKNRISYYGDGAAADQWTRMRQDKLRSLNKALYYSYQAAIVQKYSAAEGDNQTNPFFRCLINKQKQHVDYEDKEISIPFEECSVLVDPIVKDNKDLLQTDFHTGTTFIWHHGNKQEWVPDSYWIVYMQYSEETAYFRGEIRKADDEIEIIPINKDGSEGDPVIYHGWTSGPDETSILWNVKKGVIWNDMNYTKQIYIAKDETTLAFFKRFDRVNINGKPWEVQAYNDNYGASSNDPNTGIIRVAVKETYTSTNQKIKEEKPAVGDIIGPEVLSTMDERVKYRAPEGITGSWSIASQGATAASDLIRVHIDEKTNDLYISVKTDKTYKDGFDIKYGEALKHVTIKA